MSQEQWDAVDRYLTEHVVGPDAALEATLKASAEAGLPPINVAPNQGKLLHLLAVVHGARRILEIGTLGGYSAIWLARALPAHGRLVSLEADAGYAEVATSNIARAGLSDVVDVRTGAALDTLPMLAEEEVEPFDLVFIDADKSNNPRYFDWALRLTRRGSLIIVDNVVRGGAVIDATSDEPGVIGTRRLFEQISTEPRVNATAVQTVGSKGYDGFLLATVTAAV